jgi:hypothetical protein
MADSREGKRCCRGFAQVQMDGTPAPITAPWRDPGDMIVGTVLSGTQIELEDVPKNPIIRVVGAPNNSLLLANGFTVTAAVTGVTFTPPAWSLDATLYLVEGVVDNQE